MKIFLITLVLASAWAVPKKKLENLELFNKVLFLVESQYYRDVDVQKLVQGAIKGMLETLDPHSSLLTKESFEKMQIDTSGEFGGLGIEVTQKDGVIFIITPLDDTPAYRAGLESGDKIVEINHEATMGMTLEQAVKKMKGKPKSPVHLGIMRKNHEGILRFTLKREVIKIRPVRHFLMEDEFAFIRLAQFQSGSAKAIARAIKKMAKKSKKLKGIILDLRSNPGGLLDEAVKVSSLFLENGIVVSTEGRDPNKKEIRYVLKKGHKEVVMPMVVLINGASASASEIVAGALQDHNRAIIMGAPSFGKGSVQTVAKIDKENGVKLTIAQYMTPKNRKIQALGIVPDIFLDEVDALWVEKNKKEGHFIREKDLRGHIQATIKTAEEKKFFDEQEKIEKKRRISQFKNKKDKKDKKEKKEFKKYNPNEDFQVIQAINFLKGYRVFRKIKSGKKSS